MNKIKVNKRSEILQLLVKKYLVYPVCEPYMEV